MKYIYYILGFLLLVSILIGIELKSKRNINKDVAIIINDRIITSDELRSLYEHQQPCKQSKEEFLNSLITKELLIQESKKIGIDKEESFRKSIQNFYEQSLIKQLIDRKLSSISVEISEDELNKYIELMNNKYYVTIFTLNSPEEINNIVLSKGEKKILFFDDLSEEMRKKIINLKLGENTPPIKCENNYIVIKLDKIERLKSSPLSDKDREKIKNLLIDEKKNDLINDWIFSLRTKAKIEIKNSSNFNKTWR